MLMHGKKSIGKAFMSAVIAALAIGCTVVEKEDGTPDTTVVNPPDKKTDIVVTPPAGGGTTTTTGN